MTKKIRGFMSEEKGQGMAEYALILALIALAAVGAFTVLGTTVSTKVTEFAGLIS